MKEYNKKLYSFYSKNFKKNNMNLINYIFSNGFKYNDIYELKLDKKYCLEMERTSAIQSVKHDALIQDCIVIKMPKKGNKSNDNEDDENLMPAV